MSDLFHKDVPLSYILEVFEVMNIASWHQYQILTKRSERLAEISHHLNWTENIWMGVSVESNDQKSRIDWVIAGGESGPGAREVKKEWITDIRDQCLKSTQI